MRIKRGLLALALSAILGIGQLQAADHGYKGFVEGGFTAGLGNWDFHRLEILTSHGYQFSPYLFVGGGSGFQYYTLPEWFELPLFVDLRSSLLPGRKLTPVVGVKMGYTLDLSDGITGNGFFASPTVGLRYALNGHGALRFDIGYAVQRTGIEIYIPGIYYDTKQISLNGLALRLGYEF